MREIGETLCVESQDDEQKTLRQPLEKPRSAKFAFLKCREAADERDLETRRLARTFS